MVVTEDGTQWVLTTTAVGLVLRQSTHVALVESFEGLWPHPKSRQVYATASDLVLMRDEYLHKDDSFVQYYVPKGGPAFL